MGSLKFNQMPFFVFQIWWQCSKASWDSADWTTSRSMLSIKLMTPKKYVQRRNYVFLTSATGNIFFSDMFIDIECITDHSAPSPNQPTQTSTHHGAVLWSIGWPGGWFASFSESLLATWCGVQCHSVNKFDDEHLVGFERKGGGKIMSKKGGQKETSGVF